jgi:6-phosphogluconolactonase (cycloisomerase 2 family)
MRSVTRHNWFLPVAAALVVHIGSLAFGQSASQAVFVSNNGNLEGSISSFIVNPDGTLTFVDKLVTGTRPNTSTPNPGCNAYEISITPSGRYLATAHPAGDQDGLGIIEVGSDATLSLVLLLTMTFGQDGPLDVIWINNTMLAVARAQNNTVATYRFNPAVPSLTTLSVVAAGTGLSFLELHPSGQYLYANDTGARVIRKYSINLETGFLALVDSVSTGAPFPLELALSPDGTKLYSAGGISDGGNKVIGMDVAPDGSLSPMAGSPFVSPGASPSNVFVSPDGQYLVVGHGTDATARVFTINPTTGALTYTGHMFDVGLQGTLGDVRVMRDLLFITDNSTAIDGIMGLYSFTLGAGGALTQNQPIASTNGITPRSLAHWTPFVLGDMDCNGVLNADDVPPFTVALLDPPAYPLGWPYCDVLRGDMNDDGDINGDDIQLFVAALLP